MKREPHRFRCRTGRICSAASGECFFVASWPGSRSNSVAVPHPLETIANLYKLTPAEMRVLMMIIEVGGVPKIAPVLGVSERAVKTHLTHVFEKTGTLRQVDLVKLVAGYMNPLA
jgi:DNA-binding CsgD family transcriptional regulator